MQTQSWAAVAQNSGEIHGTHSQIIADGEFSMAIVGRWRKLMKNQKIQAQPKAAEAHNSGGIQGIQVAVR